MLIKFEVKGRMAKCYFWSRIWSQQFAYVVFCDQRTAECAHDLIYVAVKSHFLLNDGHQAIGTDSCVNLDAHCVVGDAPERLDFEMLLNPFEEELHLPTFLLLFLSPASHCMKTCKSLWDSSTTTPLTNFPFRCMTCPSYKERLHNLPSRDFLELIEGKVDPRARMVHIELGLAWTSQNPYSSGDGAHPNANLRRRSLLNSGCVVRVLPMHSRHKCQG